MAKPTFNLESPIRLVKCKFYPPSLRTKVPTAGQGGIDTLEWYVKDGAFVGVRAVPLKGLPVVIPAATIEGIVENPPRSGAKSGAAGRTKAAS